MKPQRQAYIYALSAIICWSTIGSAFKISLRYTGFIHLLLYSSFVAVMVLFIFLVIQKKLGLIRKLTPGDIFHSAFLGFLNPYLYYLVLLKAYELLPAQEAGTLNYIWPLMLVILSIPMLHQKISFPSLMAIVISFCGIIIISTHGRLLSFRLSDPLGVILAIGSTVFWALYWILNMKDKREEVSKLFLNFCFGFLYILITAVFFYRFPKPVLPAIIGSVYLGFFEMGIPFFLWLMALKHSSTTVKVSNLIYLSPFISLVFINYFVGEKILPSTILGLGFIVGGIFLQQKVSS